MSIIKNDINECVKILEDRLLDVEIKFISSHTDPIEHPASYAIDVQSYAVLCHAAFEEYAESLCMRMLDEIENQWVNNRNYSVATLCLLHFDLESVNHSTGRWGKNENFYDFMKNEIHNRKSKLSTYALQNNHGVSLKYLHSLFLPVGLDMPRDVNENNSLEQLARLRGFYAHAHTSTRPNAVTIISPQMAVQTVDDVLAYMNKIANKAITMSYYHWW